MNVDLNKNNLEVSLNEEELFLENGEENTELELERNEYDINLNQNNIELSLGAPPFSLSNGDKHFLYEQAIPSNSWRINHNLDKYPSVSVVDSALNEVVGEVHYVDKNTVIVNFTSSFSGKAFLN